MAHLVWVMAAGQTGKVLRAQLRDADGAVDLDGFSAVPKVQIARTASSALLVDLDTVPDADQSAEVFDDNVSVSGKGWLSVTTEATMAALVKRTTGYLVSFECMNGADAEYFPLSRKLDRTYGRIIVQDPLGP